MEENKTELIIGYLQGKLTESELHAFYQWIDESKDNEQLYFDLKTVYDLSKSSGRKYDTEQSWKRLMRKYNKSHRRLRKTIIATLRYAAVAVFAVGIVLAIQFLNREEPALVHYESSNGIAADIIELPDGTRVSISTMTDFSYATNYARGSRDVYLNGEAYFDVVKNDKYPFIVKTRHQDIKVTGTKFNVMAYDNDSIVMTTLMEGSLLVTTAGNKGNPINLKPNQQLVYNKNQNKLVLSNIDPKPYANWINGYYYFQEQTLENILHRLGNLYGTEFVIESETLKNRKFEGTFYRGQSIKEILEIINLSIPIKYKIIKDKVHIY